MSSIFSYLLVVKKPSHLFHQSHAVVKNVVFISTRVSHTYFIPDAQEQLNPDMAAVADASPLQFNGNCIGEYRHQESFFRALIR